MSIRSSVKGFDFREESYEGTQQGSKGPQSVPRKFSLTPYMIARSARDRRQERLRLNAKHTFPCKRRYTL